MNMPEPSPMSIAIDRAMKAAEADPLVTALALLNSARCIMAIMDCNLTNLKCGMDMSGVPGWEGQNFIDTIDAYLKTQLGDNYR